MKYILFVCWVGLGACQQTNSICFTEKPCNNKESESQLVDIRENYANRLHQQHDWTDATLSYQINGRSQENRLRTRRSYPSSFLGTRLYHKNNILHAILFQIEEQRSRYLNAIATLTQKAVISLPSERISFQFHSFW